MAKNIGSEEGWITIPDTQSSDNDGWITVPDKPKSWADTITGMGWRTVPAVLGALGGVAIGGPPGAAIGGAAGSGLGELLGQWWDDEGYNPGLIATETALGAIPGLGKAAKPGLMGAIRYGTKQGLIQGAAGSVPRHIAQTHEWELPGLQEAAVQTGLGGAFGGVVGAGFHAAGKIPRRHNISIERPIEPLPEGLMQGDLLAGVPPDTMGTQQQLPFEPRFREAGDREVRWLDEPYLPYNEGSQQQDLPFSPASDEGGQGLLFPDLPSGPSSGPTVPPTQPPPPTSPVGPQGDNLPPAISAKGFTQADIAYWTAKGYRPGGQGPDGFAQLVRTPTAQPVPTQPTSLPTRNVAAGPMEQGQIPLSGNTVSVPRNQVTDILIKSLAGEGFTLTNPNDGGNVTFTRTGPSPESDDVAYDLVRPPQGTFGQPGRGPIEGEQTGRVADFEPKGLRESLSSEELLQYLNSPSLTPELRTQIENLLRTRGVIPNPENAPPFGPNTPLYKGWDWNTRSDDPLQNEYNRLVELAETYPDGHPEKDIIIRRIIQIEDSTDPTTGQSTLPQNVIDMGQWPPRTGPFRQGTIQPESITGEPGLPGMGPARLTQDMPIPDEGGLDIAALRLKNIYPNEPRQMSMLDDMADEEIVNFLKNEDTRPPESHDLSAYRQGEFSDEEPSFDRIRGEKPGERNARIDALKQGINEAYKTGDMNRVIELSRQLDEIIQAGKGYGIASGQGRGPDFDEPAQSRVEGGGYKASMNVERGIENITRDYTSPLPAIMNREGMQNALDAADTLGSGGEVKVRLNYSDNTIEIYDNGKGMDDATLGNKLFEAFSTGKEGEAGATGGKGIGSASYIYGGEKFEIESISVDGVDGVKYRIVAGGTPEQFMKGEGDFLRTPVPNETPTGTTIKITLKSDQNVHYAKLMLDNIVENSRNRQSRVVIDSNDHSYKTPLLRDVEPDSFVKEHRFASSKDDKLIGKFTTINRNSDVEVLIPKFDNSIARNEIKIHYLNNGMYQFSETMSLGQMADGVPEKVLIDIHPLVDDLDDLYPFINTREDIKRDIREEVTKFVQKNISSPGINKRKNRIQELYNSMKPIPIIGTKRKTIIYDPGNRLTPQEMDNLVKNPVIQQLVKLYDNVINNILASTGRQKWMDRLEGVGLVFDEAMNGIHIPNPATGKSTILINPFTRIDAGMNPQETAWKNIITSLHEGGHVGSEYGAPIQLSPRDLQDPRLGTFLSAYMNQLVEHGDVGIFTNTGHGMDFAHRLGEVYAKFGVENTFNAAANLEWILTGGRQSGGYRPEIQDLLRLYKESRGRPAVTEDLLSGTGTKQANRRSNTTQSIPGNNPPNGTGTTPPTGRVNKEPTTLEKAIGLPTALTTTGDLSAALRQGLPMVFTKEWWKALGPMFKAAGSQKYADEIDRVIKSKQIFQRSVDTRTNKVTPSFAEKIGMRLIEGSQVTKSEANLAGDWAETGGFLGPAAPVYAQTVGRYAKASNRAYATFLNHLRANTLERLLNDSRRMAMQGASTGRAQTGMFGKFGPSYAVSPDDAINLNAYNNEPLAKEIAAFVNTATGRGPLKFAAPGGEINLESSAKALRFMLFSPRLVASRIRMLNPFTYAMASPTVRKQYMKAALSTAVAWSTISGLAKMAGAEVSEDTNSSDFGKIKIGNTRLDPGGGFQQFLVAASRLITGKYTSSATEQEHELGRGFQATTRKDIAERFMSNKLNPVAKFAWDLMNASEYQPVHVVDRTAQMFVPLVIQDLKEIIDEDPDLLPLMAPIAFGMGTQTYGSGAQAYRLEQAEGKLVPAEYDYMYEGGAAIAPPPEDSLWGSPNVWQ